KQSQEFAQKVNFNIVQNDSVLTLPTGIFVTQQDKFRNQQILVVIEIPQGKKIEMDGSIDVYHWFDLNLNKKHKVTLNWNNNWNNSLHWNKDEEMIMGERELKNTAHTNEEMENTKDALDEIEKQQKELEDKRKGLLKEKEMLQPKTIDSSIKKNTTSTKHDVNQIYLGTILLDKFSM
ncbi:MAG: hypothetical protein NTZ59_04880, partial [Bacteroidetes bacterium]|nr:hypothetical protein [Bacteroidota bacterium]